MKLLKRAAALTFGTALVVALGPTTADAQNKEIRGNAVAVSDSSLTLKAGEQTLSFVIEKGTLVEAKGASTRTRRAEAIGDSPAIKVTDYVKSGDPVLVSYRVVDGKNFATVVRPISAAGGTSASADSAKNVQAKVKSISGNTLILDQSGRDWTFAIDRDTDVKAVGGSHATRKAGGSLPITEFVHVGDIVRVEYWEAGGSMKAREIQVRSRATIPVK
jgi:hypothetical protein